MSKCNICLVKIRSRKGKYCHKCGNRTKRFAIDFEYLVVVILMSIFLVGSTIFIHDY